MCVRKNDMEIERLLSCFQGSFVNHNNEAILKEKGNVYICLSGCYSEDDVKAKVLEWCSRDASKAMPFHTEKRNKKFRQEVRDGINRYLETDFSEREMLLIYQSLGNCINHQKTMRFIDSGYNLDALD